MAAAEDEVVPSHVLAWHRAMPFTRMVDCGMDQADARTLLAETLGGRPWDECAEALGDRQWQRAEQARADGHHVTRLAAVRAAAAAYNFGQISISADSPRKIELHGRFVAVIDALVDASEGRMRTLELPWAAGQLLGRLCLPIGVERPPTVIVWGGLSGWGTSYLRLADALNARGLACLLADGPGQGLPRLRDGIYLDVDFVAGFDSFVDAVIADPSLGDRVGVQGNSYGGLLAAHVAAADRRVGAVAVNGAPAHPAIPTFRTAREQLFAAVGLTDDAAVRERLAALDFDPAVNVIACPLLVIRGGADPLADEAAQEPFSLAAAPARLTEFYWADGEHTVYNHADERDAACADWFMDQLG